MNVIETENTHVIIFGVRRHRLARVPAESAKQCWDRVPGLKHSGTEHIHETNLF